MAILYNNTAGFERLAKQTGFTFSGVDAPVNPRDLYGLGYGDFLSPPVKAIQEQQVIIAKQQAINDKQQQEISDPEQRPGALESIISNKR
ncbi:MAG: hypothetical protein ABI760_19785 [Ferruginibacter sp.]